MPPGQKKTINAKQAARDLSSGITDLELMRKYELSPKELEILKKKLAEVGLLNAEKKNDGSTEQTAPLYWECPACGARRMKEYSECPQCGIVVAKADKKRNPDRNGSEYGSNFGAASPSPRQRDIKSNVQEMQRSVSSNGRVTDPLPIPIPSAREEEFFQSLPQEDSDGETELEPRSLDRQEWIMILASCGAALLCLALFWPAWILSTFKTLVHEMGHAIVGWVFGYPSFPAFDFMYGGGVTLHTSRHPEILIAIYVGLAFLVYLYRNNKATIAFLVAVICIHAMSAYTQFHSVIILFMGHGMELMIGGLFLYRALSGRSIVHPAERPLYAVIGFFIIFSDIGFAFRLLTSEDAREDYLSSKGGDIDMDFIRIANDHLYVSMNSVVFFFLVCCILALMLGVLAFRYEPYVHSAIVRLWVRDSGAREDSWKGLGAFSITVVETLLSD